MQTGYGRYAPTVTRRSAKLETYREDAVAQDYDLRWSGSLGERRNLRKALALRAALECLESDAGVSIATLLDAPCGTGRFSTLWADRDFLQLGADLALPMLNEARAKHPDAPYICTDMAVMPFVDGGVDAAVCVRFLHLVRDRGQRVDYLRELRRVCRHGAVIDYRHSRTLRVWGRRLRHRLGLRDRAPSNPSPRQIGEELQAAGWREIRRIPVHPAPLLSDKVLVVVRPG